MPVAPPKNLQESSPKDPRTLLQRVREVSLVLAEADYDVHHAWCSVLRSLVEGRNDSGQFDDILGHPDFVRDPLDSAQRNPLEGLDIATFSAIYEFVLASSSMEEKRNKGQFFTPSDISSFMAQRASRFPSGTWLDPCCGVGNLSHALVALQETPEAFLLEHLLCSDVDELALLTARVLKALSFQQHVPNLFSALEPNFCCGDFLSDNLIESSPFEGRYDFVLMNPPYVSATSPHNSFYSSPSRDMFAFFMERAALTSKGFVAITPQVFTHGDRHKALRQILLNTQGSASIYCFDNVPDTVFRGIKFGSENSNHVNSIRAAITVVRPGSTADTAGQPPISITPLLRWRATDRADLLEHADTFLTSPPGVSSDLFPKVYPGLEELYETLLNEPTCIKDLLSPDAKGPSLTIATTPRYFISAVERPLKRTSRQILTFSSRDAWTRAYLVLNSSLSYFWWRVRDGGMTLSLKTLLSIPIPSFSNFSPDTVSALVTQLKNSEQANLVTKLNAGRVNENVKHPFSLVVTLNQLLMPRYANELLSLHSNSSLNDRLISSSVAS